MRGQPGNNKRPHARLLPHILGMDARMASQLNIALIRKLRGSLLCLAYFLTCYPWVLVQLGTVDWCRNEVSVLYMTVLSQAQVWETPVVRTKHPTTKAAPTPKEMQQTRTNYIAN